MNNFPFYQHYVIKIIFDSDVSVDEKLVDQVAKILIEKFALKVVNQGRHEFTNNGLTKFWVLSQSHLVIHSWPENYALHVDLMTCTPTSLTTGAINQSFNGLNVIKMSALNLIY